MTKKLFYLLSICFFGNMPQFTDSQTYSSIGRRGFRVRPRLHFGNWRKRWGKCPSPPPPLIVGAKNAAGFVNFLSLLSHKRRHFQLYPLPLLQQPWFSGLQEQGLYRNCGVGSKVQKLMQLALDKRKPSSERPNFRDENEWETKTISSALKTFLRCREWGRRNIFPITRPPHFISNRLRMCGPFSRTIGHFI